MASVTGEQRFLHAGRYRVIEGLRLVVLAAILSTTMGPGAAGTQGVTTRPETPPHVWLDVEGQPLPFQSDTEILEFLRTAAVVDRETIPVGVTRPQRLALERDGTRARAVFRSADIRQREVRYGERFYFRFRDSYLHECAAYRLARGLGLDSVPPAVLRRLDGTDGSIQIWVENTRDEEEQGFSPTDVRAWVTQVWDKDLFDNLILNVDRNATNVLVGQQYRLWLIDHTRAFQPEGQLLNPEALARVRRRVWDRLLAMTEEDLEALVGDHLDTSQMSALSKRRELLIEHVEGLVRERGEGAVFY